MKPKNFAPRKRERRLKALENLKKRVKKLEKADREPTKRQLKEISILESKLNEKINIS